MSAGSLNQLPMSQKVGNFQSKPTHTQKQKGMQLKSLEAFLSSIYKNTSYVLSSELATAIFDQKHILSHTDIVSKRIQPKRCQAGILKSFSAEEIDDLKYKAKVGIEGQNKYFQTCLFVYKYNDKMEMLYVEYFYFEQSYTDLILNYSQALRNIKKSS